MQQQIEIDSEHIKKVALQRLQQLRSIISKALEQFDLLHVVDNLEYHDKEIYEKVRGIFREVESDLECQNHKDRWGFYYTQLVPLKQPEILEIKYLGGWFSSTIFYQTHEMVNQIIEGISQEEINEAKQADLKKRLDSVEKRVIEADSKLNGRVRDVDEVRALLLSLSSNQLDASAAEACRQALAICSQVNNDHGVVTGDAASVCALVSGGGMGSPVHGSPRASSPSEGLIKESKQDPATMSNSPTTSSSSGPSPTNSGGVQ